VKDTSLNTQCSSPASGSGNSQIVSHPEVDRVAKLSSWKIAVSVSEPFSSPVLWCVICRQIPYGWATSREFHAVDSKIRNRPRALEARIQTQQFIRVSPRSFHLSQLALHGGELSVINPEGRESNPIWLQNVPW
jgi:hypothetical protein